MKRPSRITLAIAAIVASALGCGGSGTSSPATAARMSVHLVDGPGEYLEVNVHVLRVEIEGAAGWVTLGTVDRTIDLLHLVNGVEETLVDGATLPAGHYGQLRLVLGDGNTVRAADGLHDLVVPSGLRSGVKLPGSFDVRPGTTKDVFVDLDAHRSVFVHRTGASDKYILRPVVRAVDRIVTGSISGVLTDAATHAPLAGVDVTAQRLVDGSGPVIARATRTDSTGKYALDLLKLSEGPYHVVSQPLAGGAVYVARASPALALTDAAPTPAWDAAFTAATEHGGIGGAITPVATADQADVVDVTQALDTGAGTPSFIVRSAAATVTGTAESYAVPDLPAGTYAVALTRRTLDAAGNETLSGAGPVPATVAGGATANVPLAVP